MKKTNSKKSETVKKNAELNSSEKMSTFTKSTYRDFTYKIPKEKDTDTKNSDHQTETPDEKKYKNIISSFKDYHKLSGEETHSFKNVSINMFEKGQIWACRPFSSDHNTISEKHRMYYIINPAIGYGKILAAPISYSYQNGIPIEVGKNKLSHIICTNMIIIDPIFCDYYVGVAPIEVRNSVDMFLQFLITGNTEFLSEEIVKEFDKQLNIFKEKDRLDFTAFQGSCNERSSRASKNIRNTQIGEAVDIRDIYMYNIEKSGKLPHYSKTYYSNRDNTHDESQQNDAHSIISKDSVSNINQPPKIVKLIAESRTLNKHKTDIEKYIILNFSSDMNTNIFMYSSIIRDINNHYNIKYKLNKKLQTDFDLSEKMNTISKMCGNTQYKSTFKNVLTDLKNTDIFSLNSINEFLEFRNKACELFIIFKKDFEKVKDIYEKFVSLRNVVVDYRNSI